MLMFFFLGILANVRNAAIEIRIEATNGLRLAALAYAMMCES